MDNMRVNSGWQLIRSVVAIDNPALAAATYDSKPTYAQGIISSGIKGLELMLAAIGDNNGVVAVRLWGGRNPSAGPAKLVADITFTLGTMEVNADPQTQEATDLERYADTAVVTSQWPVDIKVADSGNNRLCTVSLDGLDLAWIAAEVITLTNVTRADVFFGYFN